MRRALPAPTAIAVAVVLSGCSLLTFLQPVQDVPPIEIGVCLDGMNGADSARTSVVDCAEPHLFEITAIDGWPGMGDAVAAADDDRGKVWDAIHLVGGSPESAEYGKWASRDCNEAAQRVIGIADVEVDGHTAADLWLRVGGTYGVDLSLGSRAEFVAGDFSTICSLAWYDSAGKPRLISAPAFELLVHPGFDADMRECWADDYTEISCEQPHAAQVLLSFEGLEAFGPELIGRAAAGGATEADWTVADAFCEALLLQTLPSTADLGELGFIAETSASYGWDEFDGTVDPDGGYWFSCLAAADAGENFTGDVFDGSIVLETTGSAA